MMVCGFHHREFERHDWRPIMLRGVPHWIPPAYIDAEQKPQRNLSHHPELLVSL